MGKILIDPVTRIEGHLKIESKIKTCPQKFRGIVIFRKALTF